MGRATRQAYIESILVHDSGVLRFLRNNHRQIAVVVPEELLPEEEDLLVALHGGDGLDVIDSGVKLVFHILEKLVRFGSHLHRLREHRTRPPRRETYGLLGLVVHEIHTDNVKLVLELLEVGVGLRAVLDDPLGDSAEALGNGEGGGVRTASLLEISSIYSLSAVMSF